MQANFPVLASPRAAVRQPRLLWQLPELLRVLHRVSPVLSWVGWLNVGLAGLALALLPFDHRLVTGLPVWLKPLKFSLSIVAYAWTLGWLLADLPAPAQRAVRRVGWAIALSLLVEQAIVFGQAARGTSSHYNQSSLLNGVLFGLMGVFIAVNTLASLWALYLALRYRPHGSAGYVWGLRLGLAVSIAGAVLGGFMIHHGQHTVGHADGGPGLPGLGWSTVAGDVRIAHFLGLHALQALPLLGWALGRWVPRRAVRLTVLGAAGYAAVVAALLGQALAGRSAF